jgi:hypothetical protein
MSLTAQQKKELKRLVELLNQLLEEPTGKKQVAKNGNGKRLRRSGAELTSFRRKLKTDRKAGVPVAELAKKYGVTPSYIYQMR